MLMFFAGSKLTCTRCVSRLLFPECIFSHCPGSFCSFPFSFHSLPFMFPLILCHQHFRGCMPVCSVFLLVLVRWEQAVVGCSRCAVPRAVAGGGFTLQAEPLPPKHNQLCLQDTGTLLGLQPRKWLNTWSPLCLIKPFSSTPGKKNK